MKKLNYIIGILFIALMAGCQDEDGDITFADDASAPQNLSALFTITQDNTGLVTLKPNGENVISFELFYGHGESAEPVSLAIGEYTTHIYPEGIYDVRIIATGINGKTSEITLPLTVTFRAPENLDVDVAYVTGNPYLINVTAKADYETYFEITYGDDINAAPAQFNEGTAQSHTYAASGTYTVTVTAYSGGAATTVYTEDVLISNPMALPITFQDAGLNYSFGNFGNAISTVVDNPDANGINTSSKVAMQVKNPGAEVWAGSLLTLDTPITNLGSMHMFKVKVWSPAAGVTFLLKLENLADATINHEVAAVTTVANQWEELTYDFSGANAAQSYSNVIMFCNFGVVGGGETYYFDDIIQYAGAPNSIFPITFENASIDYAFNDFQGAVTSVENNPAVGGINTSNKVMRMFKPVGGQQWAGSYKIFSAPFDFSSQHIFKMKVYSPAAGKQVIFKLENGVAANNIEKSAYTTVANQWEELTFDFSDVVNSNNYNTITLFFNAGVLGTDDVYYFDDIQLTN